MLRDTVSPELANCREPVNYSVRLINLCVSEGVFFDLLRLSQIEIHDGLVMIIEFEFPSGGIDFGRFNRVEKGVGILSCITRTFEGCFKRGRCGVAGLAALGN